MLSTIVLSLSPEADAQKRQLTVSDKVEKIAMVDQDSIRKAYKAFFAAKQKNFQTHIASKAALDKSLQSLDKRTRENLQKDSLKGAKKRDQINGQADGERSQLMLVWQQEQKKRHEERISMMTTYEAKITQAIQAVVIEGKFTSVEPVPKGGIATLTDNKRRIDITALIIKKLN
ncbi:MAG: hypothetical protein J7621_09865 [Niastella sp.]|nr:hypothetical protein [Niastella sp.]